MVACLGFCSGSREISTGFTVGAGTFCVSSAVAPCVALFDFPSIRFVILVWGGGLGFVRFISVGSRKLTISSLVLVSIVLLTVLLLALLLELYGLSVAKRFPVWMGVECIGCWRGGAVFLGVDHFCVGETPLVMLIDLEGVRILLDFGKGET